jgi:alpha-D-ribose 1-methylphosphonate 5-triphosphate synthase subunit PhnG
MAKAVTDESSKAQEATAARQEWMALLARAPVSVLEDVLGDRATNATKWLRSPETGLVMTQGRMGGSGERFNLGEVTVTRCALRLKGGSASAAAVGVAYVLGRSHRHAHLAAVADALLQEPHLRPELENALLVPLRRSLAMSQASREARAQTTRVEFFTVAREAGAEEPDGA